MCVYVAVSRVCLVLCVYCCVPAAGWQWTHTAKNQHKTRPTHWAPSPFERVTRLSESTLRAHCVHTNSDVLRWTSSPTPPHNKTRQMPYTNYNMNTNVTDAFYCMYLLLLSLSQSTQVTERAQVKCVGMVRSRTHAHTTHTPRTHHSHALSHESTPVTGMRHTAAELREWPDCYSE